MRSGAKISKGKGKGQSWFWTVEDDNVLHGEPENVENFKRL